jgi:hypothetical protein
MNMHYKSAGAQQGGNDDPLAAAFEQRHAAVEEALGKSSASVEDAKARMAEIEQILARRGSD